MNEHAPARPHIALIAAVARNGVIGRDNRLPWRLSADLRRFRTLTLGHPVLMGRKTWESLPQPLDGRENIVLSRDAAFAPVGAHACTSIEAALQRVACLGAQRCFVIGGSELYRQMLPLADSLHLTEVDATPEGDACFPSIDWTAFKETARESHPADEKNEHPYSFVTYERETPAAAADEHDLPFLPPALREARWWKQKLLRIRILNRIHRWLAQIRIEVACIRDRDPAARSFAEVLFCYPGVHAIIFHRLAHAAWRRNWFWLGRSISYFGRMLTGIEIHPGAQIGHRVFIDHGNGVVIGETAVVGDDCTIYQGVTLGGTSLYRGEKRHPTLENGVVVGAGAKVLGGFTVGEGAKIGSNAVVTKPVPARATAVGNPARIIQPESEQPSEAPPTQQPFSAYGVTAKQEDPLGRAVHGLLDHAQQTDARLDALVAQLRQSGLLKHLEAAERPDPDFDARKLSDMVD